MYNVEQAQEVIDNIKDTLEEQYYIIENCRMSGKDHRLLKKVNDRFKKQFQDMESIIYIERKDDGYIRPTKETI